MAFSNKILVVDDNLSNLAIMEEILAELYEVRFASSGEEALRIAGEFEPDLVLLDIMMPGVDGYEVCRRLRNTPRIRHAKIVLVSAKALSRDRLEGYAAGADDYVTKPFDVDELQAKVEVYLRLKQVEEVDELKTNILTLLQHETRTPLTCIISGAEIVREDPGLALEDVEDWAGMILDNANRLRSFLEKATLLSGYNSGVIDSAMEPQDLGTLVQVLVDKYADRIRDNKLDLVFQRTDPVMIQADTKHLCLALQAVIDNAVRFSPTSGTLTLQLNKDADQVAFVVTDEGPGIDAELLPQIFRGLAVKDIAHHSKGSGLGLALCDAIIRSHGGNISIRSEPGATEVIIHLPLACLSPKLESLVNQSQ